MKGAREVSCSILSLCCMIYGTDTILKFLYLSGGGVGGRREKEVEQSDARQSKYVEE